MKLAKKLLSSAATEFAESYPEGFRHDSASPTVSAVTRLVGNVLQRSNIVGGRSTSVMENDSGRTRATSSSTGISRLTGPGASRRDEMATVLLRVAHDSLRFQGEQLRVLESLLSVSAQLSSSSPQARGDDDHEIEERAFGHLVHRLCSLEARHDATALALQEYVAAADSGGGVKHPVSTIAEELLDFSLLQRETLRSLDHAASTAVGQQHQQKDRAAAVAVEKLSSSLFETLSTKHELLTALISELALPTGGSSGGDGRRRGSLSSDNIGRDPSSVERAFQSALSRATNLRSSGGREVSTSESPANRLTQGKGFFSSAADAIKYAVNSGGAMSPEMQVDGHREEILSPSPLPAANAVSSASAGNVALVEDLQKAVQDILDEALGTMSTCDNAVNELLAENKALRERLADLEKAVSRRDAEEHMMAVTEEKMHSLQRERDTAVAARAATENDLSLVRRKMKELSEAVEAADATCRRFEHKSALQEQRAADLEHLLHQQDEAMAKMQQQHEQSVSELTRQVERARLKQQQAEEASRKAILELEEQLAEGKLLRQRLLEKQSELTNVKKMFTALEASYAKKQQQQQRSGPLPTATQEGPSFVPASVIDSPRPLRIPRPQDTAIMMSADKKAERASYSDTTTTSTTTGKLQLVPSSSVDVVAAARRSNDAHVHKVLADARQLLLQLEGTDRQQPPPQDPPSAAASSCSQDSTALTRSTTSSSIQTTADVVANTVGGMRQEPKPSAPPHDNTSRSNTNAALQNVVAELRHQCQALEDEATNLSHQERKVQDRRSLLNSTLLAQRNQLLMRNAPDTEVDALNSKITTLLHQIETTLSQIHANKKSVAAKLDLARLQLNVALQRSEHVGATTQQQPRSL